MLIGEEPEVRLPPVFAQNATTEAWYILKQDVARFGPTPGFEAGPNLFSGFYRAE